MMTSQLYAPSFSLLPKSSINPNHLIKDGSPSLISIVPRHHVHQNRNKKKFSSLVIRATSGELKSSPASVSTVTSTENQAFTVNALVTVTVTAGGSSIRLNRPPDDNIDTLLLELVGAELDPTVNFGRYMYGGYFPNRPTIARANMPTDDSSEEFLQKFLKKPEKALLMCFPSPIQAIKVMAMLDLLSNHSPDEEYIGESLESAWAENPVIKAAYEKFRGNLKRLEGIIDERNTNLKLKNRVGAGVVPYELLKPFLTPGVTGMGVPNSTSI